VALDREVTELDPEFRDTVFLRERGVARCLPAR